MQAFRRVCLRLSWAQEQLQQPKHQQQLTLTPPPPSLKVNYPIVFFSLIMNSSYDDVHKCNLFFKKKTFVLNSQLRMDLTECDGSAELKTLQYKPT